MKCKIITIAIISIVLMAFVTGCNSVSFDEVGESVTKEESISIIELDKIDIKTTNIDITVIEEDRKDVLISFETANNGSTMNIKCENGVLYVTTEEPKSIQINILNTGGPKLTLYVPMDYDGDLSINTDNGDIIQKNLSLNNVHVEGENGDVELYDLSCKEVIVELNKGEVSLSIGDYDGSVDFNTNGGEINDYTSGKKIEYDNKFDESYGESDKSIIIEIQGGDIDFKN